MDGPDSPLWAAIQDVRRFVSDNDRWREASERSKQDYERLSASLNAVEDADLALQHARSTWSSHRDFGERYLVIYGALQAMYVQQDAVLVLIGFLRGTKPPKAEAALSEPVLLLREYRNWSIGHPAERAGHLVMGRVLDQEPQLAAFIPNRQSNEVDRQDVAIELSQWVDEQRKLLADLLRERIAEQQRIEYEHRMKFSDQPLLPLAQKLTREVEGIQEDLDKDGEESGGMLEFYCGQTEHALDDLESAFNARGELKPNEALIGCYWERARFALNELRQRFGSRLLRDPERLHARAFHALVKDCAEVLHKEAGTIDKRYSKPPSGSAESPTAPKP